MSYVSSQRTPFATPARALIKTMTMPLANFDFDGMFHLSDDEDEIAHVGASYLMWIVFVFILAILFQNLLVSLPDLGIYSRGSLTLATVERKSCVHYHSVVLSHKHNEIMPVMFATFGCFVWDHKWLWILLICMHAQSISQCCTAQFSTHGLCLFLCNFLLKPRIKSSIYVYHQCLLEFQSSSVHCN